MQGINDSILVSELPSTSLSNECRSGDLNPLDLSCVVNRDKARSPDRSNPSKALDGFLSISEPSTSFSSDHGGDQKLADGYRRLIKSSADLLTHLTEVIEKKNALIEELTKRKELLLNLREAEETEQELPDLSEAVEEERELQDLSEAVEEERESQDLSEAEEEAQELQSNLNKGEQEVQCNSQEADEAEQESQRKLHEAEKAKQELYRKLIEFDPTKNYDNEQPCFRIITTKKRKRRKRKEPSAKKLKGEIKNPSKKKKSRSKLNKNLKT